MEKIGRIAVASLVCAALYCIARAIWTFPLDSATYWFATLYGMACSIIFSVVRK